ncbi:hybrid sensor histidine kinase/response regulator [Pseudoduganella lutea]|uniref:Chemotaxis protein CheA n=2 Tax=Pseudoduganella lutea TaxID=321985 RepID=A0A4P6L6J4_9BURK|nr:hybrid sensor histidine kinase/response regulator [Pseudoduganella lutea]
MGEIREALGRSRTALFEAGGLEPEDQATALRLAKSHLHQAHGALQMVDADGVVAITQLAEEALDRFKDGSVKCSADHVAVIGRLYGALVEYLEELLEGAPFQPVRLFPYYAAVQQMLGAARIHPADLFFPDLAREPALPVGDGGEDTDADVRTALHADIDYGALRQRFERALLPYLKSGDPAQAAPLAEVIAEVASAQAAPRGHVFWLALQAFAELVVQGHVPGGVYVKQLFGAANLQMRRLAQGAPEYPDTVLRDALFFVAAAEPAHLAPLARDLRAGFALDGMVPPDYAAERYCRIDPEALARAKEGLAEARAAWQRLEAGDTAAQTAFGQAVALVAAAVDKLGITPLAGLMRQLVVVAEAGRNEALGLEMATALLFAGHGLDQVRHLPDDFAASAATIGARLEALAAGQEPPEPAQWQQGLEQRLRQDDTVAALAQQMKVALRDVERVLDEFATDPAARPPLADLDRVLHQLEGALAITDQPDAQAAAAHVRRQVAALAGGSGADDPAQLDRIAQNVGALGFFVDMLAQNAAGARERFAFDAGQGTFRAVPLRKIAGPESIPVLDEEVPAPPEPAPAATAPVAQGASDAAIEEELLEIFIGEAREVLAFVDGQLATREAGEPDSLALLRRSFHTLKGSGRMVGLNQFADAAAALEKVLNAWLADGRSANEALRGLLEWTAAELNAWVGELVAKGISPRSAAPLVAAAARVLEGQPFVSPDKSPDGAPDTQAAATEPPPAEPYVTDENRTAEAVTDEAAVGEAVVDEAVTDEAVAEEAVAAEPMADSSLAEPGGAATLEPAPVPADEGMRFVGRLAVPAPLFDIYVAEATALAQALARDFATWRRQGELDPEALHLAHTLAGTSGTVGFKALRELAFALETTLQAAPATLHDPAHHDLFELAIGRAGDMVASFAAGEMPADQSELIAALERLRDELARAHAAGADVQARLDGMPAVPDVADEPLDEPLIDPLAELLDEPVDELAVRLDTLFMDTYHALLADPPPAPERGAPLPLRPQLATQDESIDDLFNAAFDDAFTAPPTAQVPAPQLSLVPPPEPDASAPAPEAEQADTQADEQVDDQADAPDVQAVPLPEPEADIPTVADELDPDLLPVFLEEGADLLPQVGATLRAWQHAPADTTHPATLQRVLHTLKGSARMAGAMRLGQHAHEMETHVEAMGMPEPAAFEGLLAHYDHALLLFDQLQHPPADQHAAVAAAPADTEAAAAQAPLVRVRADILDRLVNQAGEVAITRSRLENEVAALRTALADFGDNLARLRQQLREVEMQAESQLSSQLTPQSASRQPAPGEREFDPLEFDRYTRLQELTRMMAESVDDVASFHAGLRRSVDSASDDLVQQARMTRELQRDLLRVRMVPFASIAERLYRVARQGAKEMDKRVNLDIRGGSVDMDRSVLERMAAPFEHLLRNAVVHGIEAREDRIAAGKPETGEVVVQASQQGNEIVLEFSDDGAGLDLARIRARARERGLLEDGHDADDALVANLIFEPGFSTANALTELAGRGVGMDVVRSETQALGGRIDTQTVPGQGTRFTIHLPLTLAVTQVVLLAAGGRTHAVPAALVEQVLQVKAEALDEAAGRVDVAGQSLPLHYLPALLGDARAKPLTQRSVPVLVLRAGTDRLALRADEVLGNREVVVKNIGPQLARVPGIAGATVLGSGEIVLILNPVVLAQQMAQQETGQARLHAPPAVHVAGGTIMVVDDSLTVRKVTQRLLEREGYVVLLAKDGVDALEQIAVHRPDLMLVDIEMPRMDGFDLVRHVRADAATGEIPIIMITSRSADKHRNLALQLGVNAYFGKPYQQTVLLGAIAGLLPAQGESGER